MRLFVLLSAFKGLLFQSLAHPLGLVLTMIQKHLGRKVLHVEGLDVHSSEEDKVFAALERLLGELVAVLEVYVSSLFLVNLLDLFNIIGFVQFVFHLGLAVGAVVVVTHSGGDVIVCFVQPLLVEHVVSLQVRAVPAHVILLPTAVLWPHFVEYAKVARVHLHGIGIRLSLLQHFEVVIV